jgi:hypothetical protein
MSQKTAKFRQIKPKSRGLYTPEPVRGRVLARHISGASNREIARVERIDRETVSRILTQPEIAQMMEQYRSRLLMMVPKAISAYEQALDSDDERIKVAAATKLLEGLRVFPRAGIEQAKAEPDHQKRLLMLGQVMEMVLYKSERYGISLPPGLDRLKAVES